jgi:hypothetical protein
LGSFTKATASLHQVALKKSKTLQTDLQALVDAGEPVSSNPTLMQRWYETKADFNRVMAFKANLNKLYQ